MIYAIIDRAAAQRAGHDPLDAVRAACDAGVTLFQWREKAATGAQLHAFGQSLITTLSPYGARLLVNGRADIARAIGAAGVHRPGDGLPIAALRLVMGAAADDPLIFASAHSIDEALALAAQGADAVVLSPIFETPSKPGYGPALGLTYLKAACQAVSAPVYALGGIRPEDMAGVLDAGAAGAAVLGGIFAAAQPGDAAAAYVRSARQRVR